MSEEANAIAKQKMCHVNEDLADEPRGDALPGHIGAHEDNVLPSRGPQRRSDEHALADYSDYLALEDAKRMKADLTSYFKDYDYLRVRGARPADADAWAVIDRMSSGERLWYRVGAYMAQRIEASKGRAALVALVKRGPAQFLKAHESLFSPHTK